MLHMQGQWVDQNTQAVSIERGLSHYQLDLRVAHLHQRHACLRTLHMSQDTPKGRVRLKIEVDMFD